MWSIYVAAYFRVETSHNLIVLSWDPVAKFLCDGCAATDYIELLWAFFIELDADIWFFNKSWGSS